MKIFLLNKLSRDSIYLAALIGLSLFIYRNWFFTLKPLVSGDWWYWNLQALKELDTSWVIRHDFNNLGEVVLRHNFLYFKIIWSKLADLGLDFNISSRLTLFYWIPILRVIGAYILCKYLFRNEKSAFIGSFIYSFAPYALAADPTVMMVYSLAPFGVYLFMKTLETFNYIHGLSLVITLTTMMYYEERLSLIILFMLALASIVNYKKLLSKSSGGKFFFLLLLFVLLNIPWIVTTWLSSTSTLDFQKVVNRPTFAPRLHKIGVVITTFKWNWDINGLNTDFVVQQTPFFFWLIPAVYIGSLLNKRKDSDCASHDIDAILKLWLILALFLLKQDNQPYGKLYTLLQENSLFAIYRESSKFYLFFLLTVAMILASAVRQKFKSLVIPVIIFMCLWTLYLVFFSLHECGSILNPSSRPNKYLWVETKLANQNTPPSRVLWYPNYTSWSFFSNSHPRLAFNFFMDYAKSHRLNYTKTIETLNIGYIIVDSNNITNKDFAKFITNAAAKGDILYVGGYEDLSLYEIKKPRPIMECQSCEIHDYRMEGFIKMFSGKFSNQFSLGIPYESGWMAYITTKNGRSNLQTSRDKIGNILVYLPSNNNEGTLVLLNKYRYTWWLINLVGFCLYILLLVIVAISIIYRKVTRNIKRATPLSKAQNSRCMNR